MVDESIRSRKASDIMPTLLDWLGLDIPAQCRGSSLLPAAANGALGEHWRTEAYWEYDFSARHFNARDTFGLPPEQCRLAVIRDATSKYVHFQGLPNVYFDLENDPVESVNLAEDPGYRCRVEDAARRLESRSQPLAGVTDTHLSVHGQPFDTASVTAGTGPDDVHRGDGVVLAEPEVERGRSVRQVAVS